MLESWLPAVCDAFLKGGRKVGRSRRVEKLSDLSWYCVTKIFSLGRWNTHLPKIGNPWQTKDTSRVHLLDTSRVQLGEPVRVLGFFGLVFVWLIDCLFVFRDRISLCSPGCPGTNSVDQAGLKLRNLPASVSQVVGLTACATTARLLLFSLFWYFQVFLVFQFCLSQNSLCRPYWPCLAVTEICLCLPSWGIKGMRHHPLIQPNLLKGAVYSLIMPNLW